MSLPLHAVYVDACACKDHLFCRATAAAAATAAQARSKAATPRPSPSTIIIPSSPRSPARARAASDCKKRLITSNDPSKPLRPRSNAQHGGLVTGGWTDPQSAEGARGDAEKKINALVFIYIVNSLLRKNNLFKNCCRRHRPFSVPPRESFPIAHRPPRRRRQRPAAAGPRAAVPPVFHQRHIVRVRNGRPHQCSGHHLSPPRCTYWV